MDKVTTVFNLFADGETGRAKTKYLGAMVRSLGYTISDNWIRGVVKEEGKEIQLKDFARVVKDAEREKLDESDIIRAFEVFDRERTGKLPIGTIKAILQGGNEILTNEDIDNCMELLAPNPDGIVSYAEVLKRSSV